MARFISTDDAKQQTLYPKATNKLGTIAANSKAIPALALGFFNAATVVSTAEIVTVRYSIRIRLAELPAWLHDVHVIANITGIDEVRLR